MPRPTSTVPSYLLYKASGRAYCVVRWADGSKEQVYLGEYGSSESKEAYGRVLAGHTPAPIASNPTTPRVAVVAPPGPLTVAELILRFMEHVQTYYRHYDGTETGEVTGYRHSLRPLNFLFGALPVSEFGPLALQRVRDLMVSGYTHPDYGPQPDLSRKVTNQRIGRIKRCFKWGTSQELVPPSVFHGLASVAGLKSGRCLAREIEPVLPVPREVVEATLPELSEVTRAMVQVQALTGMRPAEVCGMRADEIDRSTSLWVYTPAHHKTAYRGKRRSICIGPRGQALLASFLEGQEAGFLFSPRKAVEAVRAGQRSRRTTKIFPSSKKPRKKSPKRKPGERYTVAVYDAAIARAAARAGVPHWSANQLRHLFATEVRAVFGLEAAQVALGHAQANVTQVYAERDQTLAARVAAEIG